MASAPLTLDFNLMNVTALYESMVAAKKNKWYLDQGTTYEEGVNGSIHMDLPTWVTMIRQHKTKLSYMERRALIIQRSFHNYEWLGLTEERGVAFLRMHGYQRFKDYFTADMCAKYLKKWLKTGQYQPWTDADWDEAEQLYRKFHE